MDEQKTGVHSPRGRVLEIAALFLRLGATAFGGPAAHIAMMHDEVVRRRRWLTDQEFLDLLGATNLIPGPNSTEMAIHIGLRRGGWPGLVVAGTCFIVPAMVIVMAIAWAYTRFGTRPEAFWLLYGVKPAVIAIIVHALWHLGRRAVTGPFTAGVALAGCLLYFVGVHELLILFGAAVLGLIAALGPRVRGWAVGLLVTPAIALQAPDPAVPFTYTRLFLTFVKVGSVLYGSGYVLLAFLERDLVLRYGWLSQGQLLDAIAVGQVTPGPVFTTATFIGYVLGGPHAALIATAGIFLPAFVFVALSGPFVPRLRESSIAARVLDGVNAASLGLMAAVTWRLGTTSVSDLLTALIAVGALVALVRYRVNSTWIILAAAAIGLLRMAVGRPL